MWNPASGRMAGLGALQAGDYPNAQSSFNAVYGQLPGELAPKLALAIACEYGKQPDVAESLYRTCAATDANYVTPAAFGIARVRAGRGDLPGSLAALELVPQTSRGYQDSQRLRIEQLIGLGNDPLHLAEALRVLGHARLDEKTTMTFQAAIYERALAAAGKAPVRLGQAPLTASMLRDTLEDTYRRLARLTAEPAGRAELVDKANAIRPWSLL